MPEAIDSKASTLFKRDKSRIKTRPEDSRIGQLFQILILVLVTEGQMVQVAGTDLTITVRTVRDFT